jgi:hypothetical protein
MIATVGIPKGLMDKLYLFLNAGHTGNVVLDIKDGRVLSWKVTEFGRIPTNKIDKETT